MRISGILILLLYFRITEVSAQNAPIGLIRPLDNNHALATDSTDWKFHRAIKELLLVKDEPGMLLSFGGEIREQIRFYNHVNFGDVSTGVSDRDFYLQQRYMLHADLQMKRFLRLFVQLNSCHASGKNTLSPQIDRDDLSIMQAFADLRFNVSFPLQLRLGRQEFLFGQDRMLGLRDGPTVRQTFDGARMTVGLKAITGDLFLVQPVSYAFGVFDNAPRSKEFVMASYWTIPLKKSSLLDLYYFNAHFRNSTYANDTANENRHSLGIRFGKSSGSFTCDAEFTYQVGQFGHQDIRAWHLTAFLAYRWLEFAGHPRLSVREAVYSGDREKADGVMNTFRPVSTKSPIHDIVSVGSANIILFSPEAELVLSRKLTFTLRYLTFWRFSLNDGMYPPDVRKMTRKTNRLGEKSGKAISRGGVAELMYIPNKHITVWVYGGILWAGEYILNTGAGKDMEAFSLRASYKF